MDKTLLPKGPINNYTSTADKHAAGLVKLGSAVTSSPSSCPGDVMATSRADAQGHMCAVSRQYRRSWTYWWLDLWFFFFLTLPWWERYKHSIETIPKILNFDSCPPHLARNKLYDSLMWCWGLVPVRHGITKVDNLSSRVWFVAKLGCLAMEATGELKLSPLPRDKETSLHCGCPPRPSGEPGFPSYPGSN